MDKILTVSLPLFAMILSGFLIVRLKIIEKEMVKGLVALVFWLFLPFFIFTKTISAAQYGSLDWRLLEAYYLSAAIVFVIAAVGGHVFFKRDIRTACLRGLASISGVVGYMGLPLATMTFGDKAIVPAVMITIADNLVILAGGAFMMELTANRSNVKANIVSIIKSNTLSIIKNPLIVSVAVSIIFLWLNLKLPIPLQTFSTQMTDATGPLALVALGAALATHSNRKNFSIDTILLALLKVFVLPLFVFISAKYIFELDDFLIAVSVMMAALPVAVNVFVMASRYKTYEQEISISMLLSVVLGVVTISGLLVLFA